MTYSSYKNLGLFMAISGSLAGCNGSAGAANPTPAAVPGAVTSSTPAMARVSAMSAASATDLGRNFLTPPPTARPWVYWFVMDGNFTREGITADLEAMKAAGIGGVIFMEVDIGIPRGPVHFMSPEWQQLWKHAVKEAERLGLQVTINGGPGWTGSGGPWIKPEQSMQNIGSVALNVTGPQHFTGALPALPNRSGLSSYTHDIRVLAFPKPAGNARIADANEKSFYDRDNRGDTAAMLGKNSFIPSYSSYPTLPVGQAVDASQVIDLTSKLSADGHLNWDVPAGDWIVLRFGAMNNGASTRPAPAAGLGMESDKFSASALDTHFNDFVVPLLKTVGKRVISPDVGWNMLHIDSWEVGTQNWTPAFLQEFRKRRGYDAVPYLPTLSGVYIDSPEKSERFLWDWRQTCQELLVQNHVAHFAELGHKYGFGLSIEAYDKVMASDISLGGPSDVPMGEFWLYEGPNINYSVLEAASVGHTNGRKIVGAESFTSGGSERWQAYPGSTKALGDWALCAGINRFVIHRYQHQPTLTQRPGMTMGPYGVHWERTQTWWDLSPAYHQYLTRSQYMLRQGLPISDVCYMVAEGAPQVFLPPASATKNNPPERLGYSFDGCAPEIILNRMTVKNGQLMLPDGTSYRVLVLPERDTMTPALLAKISQLVQDGATVIGPRPLKSPSLSGGDASNVRVQQLAATLWGDCDGIKVTQHKFGKGRIIWHRSGESEIGRAKPSPFTGAQWIWYPEAGGESPASHAPVARRYFRRTVSVDNASQLQSATIALTADNSFTLSLNGQSIGGGDDYGQAFTFDVTQQLKSGNNEFAVMAQNGTMAPGDTAPNPAGLIGTIHLQYRDGRTVEIPTDNQWMSATQATGSSWVPALSLGTFNMGPWNQPATLAPQQYGDFSIVSNTLQTMKVPVDFESDGAVDYIHRRDGANDIYFVANHEASLVNANCTFRVAGKTPELWNPLTGERRVLPQHQDKNGRITVPLRFEPLQSWFVIFRPAKATDKAAKGANFPTLKSVGEIGGAWQVAFDPKWGGPGSVNFPKLSDWSQNSDKGIRYYSGKAVYHKSFVAPKVAPGTPVYLDLGTVDNLAQVKINGHDVGIVWCAPWRVNLAGYLHAGTNQLEITVANLWPNRLIGDQALPEGMRVTSTTWNPYHANDKLLPSGLLGPVKLLQ